MRLQQYREDPGELLFCQEDSEGSIMAKELFVVSRTSTITRNETWQKETNPVSSLLLTLNNRQGPWRLVCSALEPQATMRFFTNQEAADHTNSNSLQRAAALDRHLLITPLPILYVGLTALWLLTIMRGKGQSLDSLDGLLFQSQLNVMS